MSLDRVLEIFVGSIPAVCGVLVFLMRIDRRMTIWLIEHEILIADWQKRNPDQILPTRTRRA